MAKKMNILSFRYIDDETTEEYFNLIKKNAKRIDCYYCPYCMNKVLSVEEGNKSGKIVFKSSEDNSHKSLSRICERCNSFMPHTFEVDFSGINSFMNGGVTH